MTQSKLWFFRDNDKFSVLDPLHVPQFGTFVNTPEFSGFVKNVDITYFDGGFSVTNIILGEENE